MNDSAFQSSQTRTIINYVAKTYGDKLEFLWPKFSHNAIWRNQSNRKWYALLLVVTKNKLGLDSDEKVEILDLRFDKNEVLDFAANNSGIYPGYHMNKNNWITIILDDSVKDEKIFALLNHSYEISLKK